MLAIKKTTNHNVMFNVCERARDRYRLNPEAPSPLLALFLRGGQKSPNSRNRLCYKNSINNNEVIDERCDALCNNRPLS